MHKLAVDPKYICPLTSTALLSPHTHHTQRDIWTAEPRHSDRILVREIRERGREGEAEPGDEGGLNSFDLYNLTDLFSFNVSA